MKAKSKRGGARPGAGAKKKLDAGKSVQVYLDHATMTKGKEIGEGTLSAGIRIAVDRYPLCPCGRPVGHTGECEPTTTP